jgi:four helix bundle protein
MDAYRAAVFLIHLARTDACELRARGMSRSLTDQLLEAAASVSGNLSEGYSRSTRADRLRFLSYALGSGRECQSWYFAEADDLASETVENRLQLLARIRSLVLGLTRSARKRMPPGHGFEP